MKLFSVTYKIYFGLLIIIRAAITPGIHPHKVKIKTITIEPQPLSKTANGGNMIDKITLQILIYANLRLLINLYVLIKFLLLQLAFIYIS